VKGLIYVEMIKNFLYKLKIIIFRRVLDGKFKLVSFVSSKNLNEGTSSRYFKPML
jgi:hypothetical protein